MKSFGGGQIVEANGDISINNEKAAKALETAKSWVGTISPPGVLAYQEEEARGVWQTGNAVFMRNWPYAYALGDGDDSAVKGKFRRRGHCRPRRKATSRPLRSVVGNFAVSKYSKHPDEAIKLALFPWLDGNPEEPRHPADQPADHRLPLRRCRRGQSRADHPAVERRVHERRAASVGSDQGQVQRGILAVLVGPFTTRCRVNGTAAENLEILEAKLTELKGSGW